VPSYPRAHPLDCNAAISPAGWHPRAVAVNSAPRLRETYARNAAAPTFSPANPLQLFRAKDEILFFCPGQRPRSPNRQSRRTRRARPAHESLRTVIAFHLHCGSHEVEGSRAILLLNSIPRTYKRASWRKLDRSEQGVRQGSPREFAPANLLILIPASRRF